MEKADFYLFQKFRRELKNAKRGCGGASSEARAVRGSRGYALPFTITLKKGSRKGQGKSTIAKNLPTGIFCYCAREKVPCGTFA